MSKMIDKPNMQSGRSILWSKMMKKTSATAAEKLVKGLRSRSYDIDKISWTSTEDNVQIKINTSGLLDVDSTNDTWHKSINLAPDIHSTNIHMNIYLESKQSITFHMEITKTIDAGDELLIWFSEEALAMIDMPFLTPKNIAGHKKYRCHICDDNFEYPNPLKIHLLLSCHQESSNNLWKHIQKRILLKFPSNTHPDPPTSAFSPYKKLQLNNQKYSALINMQPLNLTVGPSLNLTHMNKWTDNMLKLPRTFEDVSSNYAADVELFASNWGKLKQGHLCVYCGKIYSRKYGLKIHIRTHTGYKPLKCKFCSRPFGDPSNLNKHVRLHASGLSQYMCPICGKILVRRRDLERHLKTQHGTTDTNDNHT